MRNAYRNTIPLTIYFSLKEFEDPTTGQVLIDARFLAVLHELRQKFGKPIRITSGYRTPSHNREVGGVTNSRHLTGQAADLVVAEEHMQPLASVAASFHELLVIREVDHVHVELAPRFINA
jgi:hypothetical protein